MKKEKIIIIFNYVIFISLLLILIFNIINYSKANITHDSVDYYSILQRMIDPSKTPIVKDLYFIQQRSPGYSIVSLLSYYIIVFILDPFVSTEKIIDKSYIYSIPLQKNKKNIDNFQNNKIKPQINLYNGIPKKKLLVKEIFFKDIFIGNNAWYEWKIIFALLLTSYFLLFIGIFLNLKLILMSKSKIKVLFLPLLIIFTSKVFMENILIFPAYATLATYGLSSIFCYFFILSLKFSNTRYEILSGLFSGFLVLTRLESILIVISIIIYLVLYKKYKYLKNLIIGGFFPFMILIIYNISQFNNPFHSGILKGDINLIYFDLRYIFANVFIPESGILFNSTLIVLGIIGLFLSKDRDLKFLGFTSIILIILYLIRIPAMYKYMGKGFINIGGRLIRTPTTMQQALMLIRHDINRYIIILTPFSIIGLDNLISKLYKYRKNIEKISGKKEKISANN